MDHVQTSSTNTSDLLAQLRIEKQHREDPDGGSHRAIWIVVAIVAVLALCAAGVWYYVTANRAVEVDVTAAIPLSAGNANTAVLQASGYVTARREATVSAQITGTLTDVLIEEGDHVEAGQVIAHLESTAQQAQLSQAQAQVHAGQALLGQFQAQLAQSQRDLKRAEDLVGRKLVSQQALELARTQVESQASQVLSQRRQIELAQAGVQGAQIQLDYATIHAPFSGVVIAKSAQVGEIISPFSAGGGFTRTGVGTIVDMDSLEIEVDVTEAYINRVQPNQPAQAILDAYPDWKIPAHVIAIIPTADRSKATVKVRIALEQKDPRILPDMGAKVSFLEEAPKANQAQPQGTLVPISSIVQRAGKSVVFVFDGAYARATSVAPGQTYGDLRLVEGIANGARVIKAPPADLADGAKVVLGESKK